MQQVDEFEKEACKISKTIWQSPKAKVVATSDPLGGQHKTKEKYRVGDSHQFRIRKLLRSLIDHAWQTYGCKRLEPFSSIPITRQFGIANLMSPLFEHERADLIRGLQEQQERQTLKLELNVCVLYICFCFLIIILSF